MYQSHKGLLHGPVSVLLTSWFLKQVPGIGILFISLTVTVLLMVFALFVGSAYRKKRVSNQLGIQKVHIS